VLLNTKEVADCKGLQMVNHLVPSESLSYIRIRQLQAKSSTFLDKREQNIEEMFQGTG
jgi:hypothetical protein